MSNPLLNLEKISQVYSTRSRSFSALENIDIKIDAGEFVGVVGPAGCGKSTLLRIITGLQPATAGQVLYRGKRLSGINRNATIVFQTFSLFPWLTVLQNVEIALKAQSLPPELRTTRALKFLDMVGLDGFETAYPRELSGGMRQKVVFARAMALEPELLCLDEPFSVLDVLSAKALRNDLLELWGSARLPTKAIVMVTHNIEEAVYMVNRVLVMDKQPGRVIADLKIDLPHPRVTNSAEFLATVDRIYATLAGQTQPEPIELGTEPGAPGGKTRALPDIPINGLIGFLEHLANAAQNRAEISHLAQELKVESDELFPLTEAAELLGFATIAAGDISMTPLGDTFAEASIDSRKEIFSSRIKRLPTFKWLLNLLQNAENHQMSREEVKSALEQEFPAPEVEEQVITLVSWGRYAEILSYDDNQEVIYLETLR